MSSRDRLRRWWWLGGLAIAALIVVVLAPLASGDPDGLERVAIDQSFAARATAPPFEVIPDYAVPGLDGPAATVVAGLVGVVIVFAIMWLLARVLVRRRPESDR